MKKIAILTINDGGNFGNRLQNYAVSKFLSQKNFKVETILNTTGMYNVENESSFKNKIKKNIKKISILKKHQRFNNFSKFDKNIEYSDIKIDLEHIPKELSDKYDFFVTGSDQVWNPIFGRLSSIDLLEFVEPKKRIAFSASFGISSLEKKYEKRVKKELIKFNAISVRENAGKQIVTSLTERDDVEVLVDPTMLLSAEEWDKVMKKPRQLNNEKFILNYFLGELSEERKKAINKIATENKCKVINILDKKDPFYTCGPSEFLYLEKNAFLICTDSFHSSVFAVIYNRPFVIFDREEKGIVSMNSRIETLISKLKLVNREYNNECISKENINHDYTLAYNLLEKEKRKANEFFDKVFREIETN